MKPPRTWRLRGQKHSAFTVCLRKRRIIVYCASRFPTAGRGARLPFDVREYCHYIVYSCICQHHILWKTGGKPKWRTWRNAESARLAGVLHALPTGLSTDKLFSPRILHSGKPAFPPPPTGKYAGFSERKNGAFREYCPVYPSSFHGFPTSPRVSFPPASKHFRAFPHCR